ncbi:MAG: OmpA family protein [Bacteroidaceae bacterium]|nr:OmpA family protein [Bacteroidaceae bacterium]
MKINKTLLAGLLMMGMASATASAQELGEKVENVFNPHWYIQVQPLGAQYTLGETSFGNLVSYNVQIAGGYNFNKYIGARLSVNAFQSRAGWEMQGVKTWKWNYVAPVADVTLNLSNAIFGYNPDRIFTLSAFAGVGANIAWGNDQAATVKAELGNLYGHNQNLGLLWDGVKPFFLGRAGLMGDFNINQNWSVGIELQANIINDAYNSKKATNSDWYFNGLIGVKYVFGESNKVVKSVDTEMLATAEKLAEAKMAEARMNEKEVVEKIVEKRIYVETTIHELNRAIYFKRAGNTNIPSSEMHKVEEVADFLKSHPEAKVCLCGYADKGTGNPTINARLAEKRVNAVADALVKKYGIDESRISIDHKGDTVQPMEGTDNRVTIAIAKSKKVVEVEK